MLKRKEDDAKNGNWRREKRGTIKGDKGFEEFLESLVVKKEKIRERWKENITYDSTESDVRHPNYISM